MKDLKHLQLLWHTKISCPSDGLVVADTMPTMLVIAAPYIGRETGRPVWVNAPEISKPRLDIGPTKVAEQLETAKSRGTTDRAPPARAGKDDRRPDSPARRESWSTRGEGEGSCRTAMAKIES
jgi:hypothetical protein